MPRTFLSDVAEDVARIPERTALEVVKLIKSIAFKQASTVVGSDRRMRNVGAKGARLGARDTYKPGKGPRAQVTVFATPPGPWSWITDGAAPHVIGFGRANRRTGNYNAAITQSRRGGGNMRKRLRFEGASFEAPAFAVPGWRTGPLFHPGMGGRGAWTKVRKESIRLVPELYSVQIKKAVS